MRLKEVILLLLLVSINLFLVEASMMGLLGGAGGVIIGFGLGKLFNFLSKLKNE